MNGRVKRGFGGLLAILVLTGWSLAVAAHEKGDDRLPAPPVRMRVIAPSAQGPWLLRIDNEGAEPMRIAADVRLLRLEVRVPSDRPVRQTYRHGWSKRAAVCDGPQSFGLGKRFPVARELVLEPGHSYVEEFDPRLICFGKQAALLVPGARVTATLGWKPKAKWSRRMAAAPFVADAAHRPRRFRPLRRLQAPQLLLSHARAAVYGSDTKERSATHAKGASGDHAGSDRRDASVSRGPRGGRSAASAEEASVHRPRAVVEPPRKRPAPDELAARMTLTTSHHADARRPTDIELSVEAHNTGQRPLFVALRSRMLSFRVEGPDGTVRCRPQSRRHHVPRDLFKVLHHGKHVHMRVMLAEVCPPGTFDRPGLYVATPVLHADADGTQYGLTAITGRVSTRHAGTPGGTHQKGDDATLVRVRFGRRPFYKRGPRQVPTRVLPR